MRAVVKKRIIFLVIAVLLYTLGFQWIPSELEFDGTLRSIFPLVIASIGYFIVIPILYWFLIIKAGKQKAWKLIIVLSLSSTCARYSFPVSIAEYFDFIMWIRYPVIAIILLFEFYLIYAIVKGLWQARKLSGDPRIHAFKKYQSDEKKFILALMMAWEPAGWYYAIPKFSRNHQAALSNLKLLSANRTHWLSFILMCVLLSVLSYYLLIDWSELAALFVSSAILWSLVFISANYRISRYYSVYIHENKLIINNAFWGFMAIELTQISRVEMGIWDKIKGSEELCFGRGKSTNLKLEFASEQTYLGGGGQFPEKVEEIKLNIDKPEVFLNALSDRLPERRS